MKWFVLQAAALVAIVWVPGAAATPWPLMLLWAVAFGAYAMAARAADTIPVRAVWGGAFALRLGLVAAMPTLSEDMYRYMWDGWVARNGINPFDFAPAAAELDPLRLDWWALINHPEISTIYPPGAQIVFLTLALGAPARLLFKFAWIATDLLAGWLVARLARGTARGRTAVLLYLWSPLLLLEVAWSGHFEPLGIAAMLGAVLVARRRGWVAGAILGLGASIKFAPLAAVPALWRRHGWLAAGLALAVPAALYLPYAGAGAGLFAGLKTYADVWEFNAGVFRLLDLLPGPAELPRWLGGMAVVAIAGVAALRRWGLGRALYWTIGAALLVSPTIHPWYTLWVLPFACLYGGRAWIVFTGTVFLAYGGRGAYLATGLWPEPVWLLVLIHGPLLALLARDLLAGAGPERLGRGGEIAEREQGGEGE